MRAVAAAAIGLFLIVVSARAQQYVEKAVVLDGGGTRLSGANLRCRLSIGQQAASGVLTAGQYRATLGFWHQIYRDTTGVAEEVGQAASPLVFRLNQNVPNPFGLQTAICYALPRESDVALRIYNSVGRVVTTLVQAKQSAGRYAVSWDVSGVPSTKLPCGTYFCRLEAGEFAATRKLVKSE